MILTSAELQACIEAARLNGWTVEEPMRAHSKLGVWMLGFSKPTDQNFAVSVAPWVKMPEEPA